MLKDIKDVITFESYKKPEHIVAVLNSQVNDVILKNRGSIAESSHFIKKVNINEDFPRHSVFIAQRDYLELMPFFKQPIFYITIEKAGKFALYRRKPEGGDQRLHGKAALGFGGHVDVADLVHDNSIIDLEKTINLSAEREIQEELSIPKSKQEIKIETRGYIINNNDEISRVHIGVWQNMVLPEDINESAIDIAEEEQHKMEMVGFFTPEELMKQMTEETYVLEEWSKMIVDVLNDN